MARKCCVCGLTNSPFLHLHSLPKNTEVRNRWISWLKNVCQKLPKNVLVCDNHFEGENHSRMLSKDSVPSIIKKTNISATSATADPLISTKSIETQTPSIGPHYSTSTDQSCSEIESQLYKMKSLVKTNDLDNMAVHNADVEKPTLSYPGNGEYTYEVKLHGCTNNTAMPLTNRFNIVNCIDSVNRNETHSSMLKVTDQYSSQVELNIYENTVLFTTDPSITVQDTCQVELDIYDSDQIDPNNIQFVTVSSGKQNEKLDTNQYSSVTTIDTLKRSDPNLSKTAIFCEQSDTDFMTHSMQNKEVINMNYNVDNEGDMDLEVANMNQNVNNKIDMDTMNTNVLNNAAPAKHSKRSRVCSVLHCNHNVLRYFTFPQIMINGIICEDNVERCKQWVKFTGNSKLLKIKTPLLHNKYYICDNHFSTEQFYNARRIKLLPNQVPSQNGMKQLNESELNHFPLLDQRFDIFSETNGNKNDRFARYNEANGKDKHYQAFNKEMKTLNQYNCPNCKETFWSKRKLKGNCLHKNNCHKYSASNNMDPGQIPDQLKNLTMIEEALISLVHPMLSVYKIKGHQFGYSGNVINFPQSVTSFTKQLPYKVEDLPAIITVRTQSSTDKPKEFHVRSKVVHEALLWLKKNNPLYSEIEISQDNLLLLPEDGNVYDRVPSVVTDESNNAQDHNNTIPEEDSNSKDISSDEDQLGDNIEECFVPKQSQNNQNNCIKEVFNWPEIGTDSISEFKGQRLLVQAFPTLFPYGVADLRDERDHNVSDSQYFQHMIRYHDGRFAQHPKFRFYAMNCLMRWNSIQKGNIYVKKNEELKDMTIDELKCHIKENPMALNKIMYQCSNVRGTKPYWEARQGELTSMIEQLGIPTIFFTLSAADLHWKGLFYLLAPDRDLETLTEKDRRQLIADNPILVDKYFTERVNVFLNKVVKPKFKVKDHWYRFEYQHRGSPHVHGLVWFNDAPDVTDLDKKSREEIQQIVDYFDELVYSEHPDINVQPPAVHSCRRELEDVINLKEDLAQLLNTVQRHTRCTPGYCLKTGKNNNHGCRFRFPKDLKEKTEMILTENGNYELETKRNDPRLNKYNPDMILIWRANMDISPVLSKRALMNYLAKYVSKAETKSKTLEELFKDICDKNAKGAKSVIQSLYMKTCSARDFSAQEVGHILMSEPMVKCSRSFVHLFLKTDNEWIRVQNNITDGESLLQKYSNRENKYECKSLWYMAKNFNFSSKKLRPNEAIVVLFPKLIYKPDKKSNEDFYRMQVILHVPWRDIGQFKIENPNESWKLIYSKYIDTIKNNNSMSEIVTIDPDELLNKNDDNEDTIVEDECTDPSYNISTEDWMAISSMAPNQKTQPVELGRRAIDDLYDWSAACDKYSMYGTVQELQSFISKQKKEYITHETITEYPDVQFNQEQTKVLTLVDEQIQYLSSIERSAGKKPPQSIIVQGSAGTGKSLVIKALRSKVETKFGPKSILVLAPTGVAALNIDGSTIHSKLYINTNKEFGLLENEAARKFCNDLKDVKFVIIDEFSMVGLNMIGMIDRRLKQATGNINENFGGLCVYFFGDIRQLPPVLDTPVYTSETPTNLLKLHGKLVWDSISTSIILTEVHRQSDPDFKQVLLNISKGEASIDDYNFFKPRFVSNVTAEERLRFRNAVRLYPLRDQVDNENYEYIEKLRNESTNEPVPIAIIPAKHNCCLAQKQTTNAVGLSKTLYLAPGAKIMLRANLWTAQGLVNGSIGEIVDIVYEKGNKPPHDVPAVLICKFDNYKGPYLGGNNEEKLVPIPVITKSWTSDCGQTCSRTQFPIQLARAITVHKAQGLTLKLIIIDIGKEDKPPGLAFVALSRADRLNGILIKPFSKARLVKERQSPPIIWREEFFEGLISKML